MDSSQEILVTPIYQTLFKKMEKLLNLDSNPLDIRKISSERKCAMTKENLMDAHTLKTFIGDATRIWSTAHTSARHAKTIISAKKRNQKLLSVTISLIIYPLRAKRVRGL